MKILRWGLTLGTIAVLSIIVWTFLAPAKETAHRTTRAKPEKQAQVSTKIFSFRKMTGAITTLREALDNGVVQGCETGVSDKDELSCKLRSHYVAAMPTLDESVRFKNGKFTSFYFEFDTAHFNAQLYALKQAYGAPCFVTTKELRNAFGIKFSGEEFLWCFKNGSLGFDQYVEGNLTHSILLYSAPVELGPMQTFTPNNL